VPPFVLHSFGVIHVVPEGQDGVWATIIGTFGMKKTK
jgi:hypothetical protein